VVSKYPIGIENFKTSSNAWNGTWLSEDEVIKIKVIDEPNGIIKLAWIESKDNDLTFKSITCKIKKGKSGLYLNVIEMPDGELTDYYFWGKIKKENQKIIFWQPSVDAFKKAHEAKKINAIIEKTDPDKSGKQRVKFVKLTDDPEVVLDLIENKSSEYFDLENPIVLMRIIQ